VGARNLPYVIIAAVALALIFLGATVFPGFIAGLSRSTSRQLTTTGTPLGGQLSILFTDSSVLSTGITAVYVSYDSLAFHSTGGADQSAWHTIQATGTTEMIALANASKTIAVATEATGSYDKVMVSLTSAIVTYHGMNYSGVLRIERVSAAVQGGLEVSQSRASAVLVDLAPDVLNVGTRSIPQFVVEPSMNAVSVPQSGMLQEMMRLGARVSLEGTSWFENATRTYGHKLVIASATLAYNSLYVSVRNATNETVTVGVLTVSLPGQGIMIGGGRGLQLLPAGHSGIAILIILPDGSVQSLSLQVLSEKVGYDLSAGKQLTLSYTGRLSLGFGEDPQATVLGITPGVQFIVTMIADGAFVSVPVIAQ
jgi:hypothetical protein